MSNLISIHTFKKENFYEKSITDINISDNIVYFRIKNGLSQNELALILNISRQAISKWERGLCFPDIENIILLAKLYNTSLESIIFKKSIQ